MRKQDPWKFQVLPLHRYSSQSGAPPRQLVLLEFFGACRLRWRWGQWNKIAPPAAASASRPVTERPKTIINNPTTTIATEMMKSRIFRT
jgi:hypothetical protein